MSTERWWYAISLQHHKGYYLDTGSRWSNGKVFFSAKQNILFHVTLLGENKTVSKKTISDKYYKNILVNVVGFFS